MIEPIDTDGDLFLPVAGLPPILPGETLFSWCARYQVLSSCSSPRVISRRLFGDSTAGLRHDFPVHMDRLIARTSGVFGTAEQAIARHTTYRCYAPFLPSARVASVIDAMRNGSGRFILSMMGLPTSRTGATTVLRACEDCIRADLAKHHIAYWRVAHQSPTSFVCRQHHRRLRQAGPDLMTQCGTEFFLPHEVGEARWQPEHPVSEDAFRILNFFTSWAGFFLDPSESGDKVLARDVIRDACLARLSERDLVMRDGRVALKAVSHDLIEKYAAIETIGEFSFIGQAGRANGNWITSLLRNTDVAQHPIKHLALLIYLFDSPAEFFHACLRIVTLDGETRARITTTRRDELDTQVELLVGRQEMSVNRAAKELGFQHAIVERSAMRLGLAVERRPRIVGTVTEAALVTALESGSPYKEISLTLNVRSSFIKDYLSTRVELKARWIAANVARKRNDYRRKFRAILDDHPMASVKEIRRIPGNGFQWLLRNDRAWLSETLPSLWHR